MEGKVVRAGTVCLFIDLFFNLLADPVLVTGGDVRTCHQGT